MFVAFTVFGAMPLFGYLLTELLARGATYHFQLSVLITGFTLFALGTIKSTFGAGEWFRSGTEVTLIGGAAACVAFYTAKGVDYLVAKSGALS